MLCDVCGKDMTVLGREVGLVGVQIKVIIEEPMDEATRQWYAEQMAPFELGRKYCICFPCWLLSLGVRPDCPEDSPMPGDPLIVY